MIIQTHVVTDFGVNCYVVGCEETSSAFVIDPGGSIEMVAQAAASAGLKIEKIINTHGHIDHAAEVQKMKELLDVPFYMHGGDQWQLDRLIIAGQMYGIKVEKAPEIDVVINDGDEIEIGNLTVKVIHTPGHTQGGCCLLVGDAIFTGDTLFAGTIGRTDFPGGDYDQLISSIKTKLAALPDHLTVYSGHGPTSTLGVEKMNNPFLNQ